MEIAHRYSEISEPGAITIDVLRLELERFAREELQRELQRELAVMREGLVSELREVSEATAPTPKPRPTAFPLSGSLFLPNTGSSAWATDPPEPPKKSWRWGRLPRGLQHSNTAGSSSSAMHQLGYNELPGKGRGKADAKAMQEEDNKLDVMTESNNSCDDDGLPPDPTDHRSSRRSSRSSVMSARLLAMEAGDDEQKEADEDADARKCSFISAIVFSRSFEVTSSTIMLLNAIWMGVQTDYLAKHWDEEQPAIMNYIDVVFCGAFVLELLCRIAAQRCSFFFGDGWQWNVFDFSVVALQLSEAVASALLERNSNASNLRLLRLLRMVRAARVARILHLVPQLRMLLVSIIDSIKSLLWTMLLVLVVTYVFGVSLTQAVVDHKMGTSPEELQNQRMLDEYFGSLGKSMLILYEAISDGVHWGRAMEPLTTYCSPWFALVFVVYMAFVLYAMMNVVTAFFVESALRAAKEDERSHVLHNLMEMFQTAEGNEDDTVVTEAEFEKHLEKPQMQAFLKAVDLTSEEAKASHFFQLLDADGSGGVEQEEFVTGCVRLTGSARAVDLAAFMYEYRMDLKPAIRHRRHVERCLEALSRSIKAVHTIVRKIEVQGSL
mmetsp:Transcript_133492/g.297793  ORF Transcript_133492/g.297793 Transcript_133492/m.297793 type:complete len:609 (-) Transcript_133492:24-1850(-)